MRLIQSLVPAGAHDELVDSLHDADVKFAVASEGSDREFGDVLFVPVEDEQVESVIELLRDAGVEEEGYVIVNDTEAVVTNKNEETGSGDEDGEKNNEAPEESEHKVSREELVGQMRDQLRDRRNYVLFVVLSAILAAAGLLINSATVIVGSMVVSPLLGPIVASNVGNVVGDDDLVRRGLVMQAGGLALAVVSAAVFTAVCRLAFVPYLQLSHIKEISSFSTPVAFGLAIALVAGIAAALSLTSGIDTALIGVVVAAAIVPAAAAVGVGVVYLDTTVAVDAGVLALVNVLSINLMTLLTLRFKGYRPEEWSEQRRVRRIFSRRAAVMAVCVLVVAAIIVPTTMARRESSTFEHEARTVVHDSNVSSTSIQFSYEHHVFGKQPEQVVIYATHAPKGVAGRIHRRIRSQTGENVSVVVYRATQSSRGSTG